MIWTLTTVSFRYHLWSYEMINHWAYQCGFNAIELWEPHVVRHEYEIYHFMQENREAEYFLPIRILSAYLDLTDFSQREWKKRCDEKINLCRKFQIPLLRLFTGQLSSKDATNEDWMMWFDRIRYIQESAFKFNIAVAFETHPGTLLDTHAGVDRFLAEVDKRNLTQIGLNFDLYHVWEFGAEPVACLSEWFSFIKHVHLKNAVLRTDQFQMSNVYHPMGRFDELTSLFNGVVNVKELIFHLDEKGYQNAATLEWFGEPSEGFFRSEVEQLQRLTDKKEKSLR